MRLTPLIAALLLVASGCTLDSRGTTGGSVSSKMEETQSSLESYGSAEQELEGDQGYGEIEQDLEEPPFN